MADWRKTPKREPPGFQIITSAMTLSTSSSLPPLRVERPIIFILVFSFLCSGLTSAGNYLRQSQGYVHDALTCPVGCRLTSRHPRTPGANPQTVDSLSQPSWSAHSTGLRNQTIVPRQFGPTGCRRPTNSVHIPASAVISTLPRTYSRYILVACLSQIPRHNGFNRFWPPAKQARALYRWTG